MIEQRKDFKDLFHGRKCFRTKVIKCVNGSFVRWDAFLPVLVKDIKRKGGSSVIQRRPTVRSILSQQTVLFASSIATPLPPPTHTHRVREWFWNRWSTWSKYRTLYFIKASFFCNSQCSLLISNSENFANIFSMKL